MARKQTRRRIRGAGPIEDSRLAEMRRIALQAKHSYENKKSIGASPQEISKSLKIYERAVNVLIDVEHAKVVADGKEAIRRLNEEQGIMTAGRTRKRRGGGLGPTSATWPPDNAAFGANIGTPVNTDNIEFEAKKGGKRRRTRTSRRSLKRK